MTCRRCQGCMTRDHFLDLQESGGDWWLEGWRCINCGHVFDPVAEQNRRLHAAALSTADGRPSVTLESEAEGSPERPINLAA